MVASWVFLHFVILNILHWVTTLIMLSNELLQRVKTCSWISNLFYRLKKKIIILWISCICQICIKIDVEEIRRINLYNINIFKKAKELHNVSEV